MLKVFVSSTSEDLRLYRAATFKVIQELHWHPVGIEHFGTDPRPTLAACLGWVAECDAFVFMQAWRRHA